MNLVILGSARKNSNTEKVVKELCPFDDYELVDLLDHHIDHYNYGAGNTDEDSYMSIAEKMRDADQILFATPVYWYAMSAHMKVFFDRFSSILSRNSPIGRQLEGKKTYLIATGSEPELPEGFEVPFKKTSEYFNMQFMGTQYQVSEG